MVIIDAFPKDGQEYEVIWTGAVRKNKDFLSNPLVEVAVQDTATNKLFTILAGITELDALRVGTCWRNGKLTRTLNVIRGQALATKVFEFDLSENAPEVIDLYKEDTEEPEYPYIPAYKFKIPYLKEGETEANKPGSLFSKETLHRFYVSSYKKAKINRLVSIDSEEVLISCMETLTGLYTPSRKEIRRMVVTKSPDKILRSQLEDWGAENHGYMVKPKGTGLGSVPLVFLAHLAQSSDVQTVVDRIMDTMEIADLDKHGKRYPNRYPEILPYHPRGLKFTATGIWLDNKKTRFLVIRVNSVTAPEEVPITVYKTIPHNQQNPVGGNGQQVVRQSIKKARETHVTADEDPGRLAGRTYILSEIESDVAANVINTVYEVENQENNEPINFEANQAFQECVEASSGELFGTKSRVAQLENEEKERLDQLSVLREVWNALHALKSVTGSNVKAVHSVTEYGQTTDQFYKINVLNVLVRSLGLKAYDFKNWMSDHGGRKMLLIQVTMSNGDKRYIVEIDRKHASESFSGAYFLTGDASSAFIEDLCKHISKNKTVVDLKPALGGAGKFKKFSHRVGEMEWVEKMGRLLAKMPGEQ